MPDPAPDLRKTQLQKFIKRAPFTPRVIVHVGARLLEELEGYQEMKPRQVIWIEAIPEFHARMAGAVAARGDGVVDHVCVQALITDRDGEQVEFHHFSNKDGSSSIFRSTDRLRREWPKVHETGKVSVFTSSRLDTLLQGLGVQPEELDILVIDIQGAELLALKGAGRYLDHAAFLVLEVSQEEIYAGAALFAEVNAFVEAAGFVRASRMVWHGDMVFIRADLLKREDFAVLRQFAEAKRGEPLPAG